MFRLISVDTADGIGVWVALSLVQNVGEQLMKEMLAECHGTLYITVPASTLNAVFFEKVIGKTERSLSMENIVNEISDITS